MIPGTRSTRDTVWFLWFVALLFITLIVGWRLRSADPLFAANALLTQGGPRAHPWRIPGVAWAPERLIRQASNTAKSARLLRAEAMIAENLGSGDARWRALAARSALLDNQPGTAIQVLDSARKRSREELSILAAAHAIRASLENRPAELGAAVEFAVRALDLDASDLSARFTLANAFENLSMVPESLAEWNRYLELEREDNWREEALRHVDGLQKIQQQRAAALAQINPSDALLDAAPLQLLADRSRAAEAGALIATKDPWLATAARETVDSEPLMEAVKANLSDHFDAVVAMAPRVLAQYANAPAHAARLQLELVFAHNRLRNTDACIAQAERLHAQPFTWIRVQALSHSSGCLRMQGNTAGALERQREAIALARSRGLEAQALRASSLLVFQLTDSGDLWRAWQENRSALVTLQTSPFSVTRIHQCLVNYSSGAERRGWPAAAAIFMRAAADTLVSTNHKTSQAANRASAAALATRAGLPSIAAKETALAAAILAAEPDSATKQGSSESVRIIAAEAWLALGKANDALATLRGLSSKLSTVERRRVSRVHGLAHALLGNDAEALTHLEPMSRTLETEMAGMQRAEASAMRREHHEVFRTQAQLLVHAGEAQKALQLWVRANGGDAEAGLPDLVWLRMEDGYAVWTQGQLRRLRVPHTTFDNLVQRIIATASAPDAKPSQAETDRLRRMIFDNADPCPTGDRELTILPDGAISAIPFPMLVDRCAVVLSASPAMLSATVMAPALIVHNPETLEGLPYLSDAALEAEAARSLAGSSDAPLTGLDAKRAVLIEKLRDARLFHFAGHGYSLAGAGGLYLADGLLSADSIRTLNLRSCSLVVLSACSTGSGELQGLANSHSLVRSFLDAGARNVIATRWNVDSAATGAIMRSFYRSLATAPNPTRALHLAMQEIRSQPNHSHPYYWAAFQLHQ